MIRNAVSVAFAVALVSGLALASCSESDDSTSTGSSTGGCGFTGENPSAEDAISYLSKYEDFRKQTDPTAQIDTEAFRDYETKIKPGGVQRGVEYICSSEGRAAFQGPGYDDAHAVALALLSGHIACSNRVNSAPPDQALAERMCTE